MNPLKRIKQHKSLMHGLLILIVGSTGAFVFVQIRDRFTESAPREITTEVFIPLDIVRDDKKVSAVRETFPDHQEEREIAKLVEKHSTEVGEASIPQPAAEKRPEVVARKPVQKVAQKAMRVPASEPVVMAPATVIAEDKKDEEFKVSIGTGANYFRIDSMDLVSGDQAVILSSFSPSFFGELGFRWDEKTLFGAQFVFEKFSLQALAAPRTYTDDSGSRIKGGFFLQHDFTDRFSANLSANFAEKLFLYAPTANSISVQKVLVPASAVGMSFDLFKKKRTVFGLQTQLSYLMSGKASAYTVKSGYSYLIGAYLGRISVLESYGVKFYLNYERSAQDTSIAKQTESDFTLKLNFDWGSP